MGALFYCSTSENPWHNLALEEYLAEQTGDNDVLMYLWQNERTVVIGRNQNALRECRADLLENEGGFLARRATGGGAVYHDLGNLCFTFAGGQAVYSLERQMKVVQNACLALGVRTFLSGRNDIISEDGRKFSGNAFSEKSGKALQHGTLMVNVNRENMHRYLTPSRLKLQAKGISSVRSRVCNLKELQDDITIPALKEAMKEAFEQEYGPAAAFTEALFDQKRIRELYDKYASWEWRFGKTPFFRMDLETIFPWGELQISLDVKNMRVEGCRICSDCLDADFPEYLEKMLTGMEWRQDVILNILEKTDPGNRYGKMSSDVLSWMKNQAQVE